MLIAICRLAPLSSKWYIYSTYQWRTYFGQNIVIKKLLLKKDFILTVSQTVILSVCFVGIVNQLL